MVARDVLQAMKEFGAHWRRVLRHRPHHFTVAGQLLCRICDAHLLEYIINSAPAVDNALTEFAVGADRGLSGHK